MWPTEMITELFLLFESLVFMVLSALSFQIWLKEANQLASSKSYLTSALNISKVWLVYFLNF